MDNIKPFVPSEARAVLADLDSIVDGFGIERTADAAADWWLESQYARVDVEPEWTQAESDAYFEAMKAELIRLGLPA